MPCGLPQQCYPDPLILAVKLMTRSGIVHACAHTKTLLYYKYTGMYINNDVVMPTECRYYQFAREQYEQAGRRIVDVTPGVIHSALAIGQLIESPS